MFGVFKKVSQSEQDDLVATCDDVRFQVIELENSLFGKVPPSQLTALGRYKRAANDISNNYNTFNNPEFPLMPRILYNKVLKEMLAARHVLSRLYALAPKDVSFQCSESQKEMTYPLVVEPEKQDCVRSYLPERQPHYNDRDYLCLVATTTISMHNLFWSLDHVRAVPEHISEILNDERAGLTELRDTLSLEPAGMVFPEALYAKLTDSLAYRLKSIIMAHSVFIEGQATFLDEGLF